MLALWVSVKEEHMWQMCEHHQIKCQRVVLVLLPVRKQRRRCVYLAEMRTLSLRHWDAAADRDAALRPQSSLSAVRLLSSSALSNAGTAMMGQPPALPVLLLLEFLPPHNVLPFFRSPSGHFSLLSSLQKYGSNTSGPHSR